MTIVTGRIKNNHRRITIIQIRLAARATEIGYIQRPAHSPNCLLSAFRRRRHRRAWPSMCDQSSIPLYNICGAPPPVPYPAPRMCLVRFVNKHLFRRLMMCVHTSHKLPPDCVSPCVPRTRHSAGSGNSHKALAAYRFHLPIVSTTICGDNDL